MTRHLTLDQFRATGRDCDDLGPPTCDQDVNGRPGRLYLDNYYIERVASSEWLLRCGHVHEYSRYLSRLEVLLYKYVREEEGWSEEGGVE